jgi:hypothetical protein
MPQYLIRSSRSLEKLTAESFDYFHVRISSLRTMAGACHVIVVGCFTAQLYYSEREVTVGAGQEKERSLAC